MEELIKQAFLHVDVIGPHVLEGHCDLIGPVGEIILPQVWEESVKPGWLSLCICGQCPKSSPLLHLPAGHLEHHHLLDLKQVHLGAHL
jgi:hypothetical protein